MSASLGSGDSPPTENEAKKIKEEEAKQIIRRIASSRGEIDAIAVAEISKTSPEFQADYRMEKAKAEADYAQFTKFVAEQVFSSPFRFIFEIIQNADDAKYSPETKVPCLTFRLRPEELLIESNQEDFTVADVDAICATNKSSKSGNGETTGEKGIGFKSVFGIATVVHIQSGAWSFRFEHKRDENGIGMVKPLWTDPELLRENFRTRFRLRYYPQPKLDFLEELAKEFEKIPHSILFATRQVMKLEIVFEGIADRRYSVRLQRQGSVKDGEIRIIRSTFGQGEQPQPVNQEATVIFKVHQATIINLPPRRVGTLQAGEVQNDKKSEILLGFQVDDQNNPIVPELGQYTFAFLPIERLAYMPFLVQGNFVLDASRQKIIKENDWNTALLRSVAPAFFQAVEWKFFHDTDASRGLRWVHFLPLVPSDQFWEPLPASLKILALKTPLFVSGQKKLKLLSKLRNLPDGFVHGEMPLLDDTEADIFLWKGYERKDIDILKALGLLDLSNEEMLERVEWDLRDEKCSSLYSKDLGDKWHTSFMKLIQALWRKNSDQKRLQRLKIIPLSNGKWESLGSSASIFNPFAIQEDSVQIHIPKNLHLNLLHPKACGNAERQSLYVDFGISDFRPELLVQKVLGSHLTEFKGDLEDAVAHFEILFWNQGIQLGFGRWTKQPKLWAFDEKARSKRSHMLFFPSEEKYGASQLLSCTDHEKLGEYGFIHHRYMESRMSQHVRKGNSWPIWLSDCAGIRWFPTLVVCGPFSKALNPVFKLVAQDNPSMLVPALQRHWSSYREERWRAVVQELEVLEAQCCGMTKPLRETVLPTQSILAKCQELSLEGEISILELPDSPVKDDDDSWTFLHNFGVVCQVNLKFYVAALQAVHKLKPQAKDIQGMYSKICKGISDIAGDNDVKFLKESFQPNPWILVPGISQDALPTWCNLDDCVWDGPSALRRKKVLKYKYGLSKEMRRLFVDRIGMKNATWEDIIEELSNFDYLEASVEEVSRIFTEIYVHLAKLIRQEEVKGTIIPHIRELFESRQLICMPVGPKEQWRFVWTHQCLWSTESSLPGREPLAGVYPDLEDFFVRIVGVPLMTLELLVSELIKAADGEKKDATTIKGLMKAVGEALAANQDAEIPREHLQNLKKSQFLPILLPDRDGWKFKKPTEEIFINDHPRYGDIFREKVDMLDFSCEELPSLHHLFTKLNMQRRYLTPHVQIDTYPGKSTHNERLSAHIKRRAYAFSCCAISYHSPKYANRATHIHELLMKAQIFLCQKISTKLSIFWGGELLEEDSGRAVVKVETTEGLKIYVPSDEEALFACYYTELPAMLMEVLGISKSNVPQAEKMMYRILNDETKSPESIMIDEDIPDYKWVERCDITEHLSTRRPGWADEEPQQVPALTDEEAPHEGPGVPEMDGPSVAPVFANIYQEVAATERYRIALQRVVQQARGSWSLTRLQQAVDQIDNSGSRSTLDSHSQDSSWVTDNKGWIGAAGELYIFERLYGLDIPDFTEDNWKSKIRRHVCILYEYRKLLPWPDPEIADIMCSDSSGAVAKFLIENTSHNYPDWLGQVSSSSQLVKYFIEVKATPKQCGTPFHMSEHQYDLMRQHASTGSEPPAALTVYALVRVYNVFSDNIGLQVYIDPWHLRDTVLEFKADEYTVREKQGR